MGRDFRSRRRAEPLRCGFARRYTFPERPWQGCSRGGSFCLADCAPAWCPWPRGGYCPGLSSAGGWGRGNRGGGAGAARPGRARAFGAKPSGPALWLTCPCPGRGPAWRSRRRAAGPCAVSAVLERGLARRKRLGNSLVTAGRVRSEAPCSPSCAAWRPGPRWVRSPGGGGALGRGALCSLVGVGPTGGSCRSCGCLRWTLEYVSFHLSLLSTRLSPEP